MRYHDRNAARLVAMLERVPSPEVHDKAFNDCLRADRKAPGSRLTIFASLLGLLVVAVFPATIWCLALAHCFSALGADIDGRIYVAFWTASVAFLALIYAVLSAGHLPK